MTDPKTRREVAAAAYAHALHTGEVSAAKRAAVHLADDVIVSGGRQDIVGKAAVIQHITGWWPNTPVYLMGGWSEPEAWGEGVVVRAEFPAVGAGPSALTLAFSFDDEGQIVAVDESIVQGSRPEATAEIPLVVRGLIDNALHNGTPMVLAYVDEDAAPSLSLRGSVRVYSATQLSLWLRSAEGGLVRAIERNPNISLLYRDSKVRSTLIVKGRGRIDHDEDVRTRVYERSPEVEQAHDPARNGVALIVDVIEIRGGTPKGPILVQP